MKVVCINNTYINFTYHITPGKVYNIEDSCKIVGVEYYIIVDDLGDSKYLDPSLFRNLDDIRDDKLEKLGI